MSSQHLPHQSHRSVPNKIGLILASGSAARQSILRNAGVEFEITPARIDEEAIKASMVAEGAKPRDIADALAEFKARRADVGSGAALVLGADQILAIEGRILSKPENRDDAAGHLRQLSGKTHELFSAAVIYERAQPVWRQIGTVRMTMHALSEQQINSYLDQAWPNVASSVGAYHAEGIGARLFSRIEGDWFSVLGLPLLELLSYLRLRGMLTL